MYQSTVYGEVMPSNHPQLFMRSNALNPLHRTYTSAVPRGTKWPESQTAAKSTVYASDEAVE